jgi:hypothetical protein
MDDSQYTSKIERERIKSTKLTVHEEILMCKVDGCGGRLEATGMVLTSNPPWYVHRCTHCQVIEKISDQKFPRTVYKEE